MEEFYSQLEPEVSFLEKEGKINFIQADLIRSLIHSTGSVEEMMKLYPDLSVRKQVLKFVKELSFKISIPARTVAEEISSPLDCFLQERKRDIGRDIRGGFQVLRVCESELAEYSEKL